MASLSCRADSIPRPWRPTRRSASTTCRRSRSTTARATPGRSTARRESRASWESSTRLLDISFLSDVAWYSALTNPDQFPAPSGRSDEEIGHGVPITYVPLRNTIFLSLAAAYLESRVLHAIEVEGVDASDVAASIYMAPNALDYSGYPDCRPEFYETVRRTLELGSKLWTEYGVPIGIETPIIDLTKAQIAEIGTKLGAPLEHTWSCYEGRRCPMRLVR